MISLKELHILRNLVMRKAKIADHGQQETPVRRTRNVHSNTTFPGKGKAKDKDQEVLLTEERFQTLLVVTRKNTGTS